MHVTGRLRRRCEERTVSWRVGVDVGGTFTDLVAISENGEVFRAKVPSTPRAPEDGLLAALALVLRDVSARDIAYVGHASTIATNALLGQMHLELPRVAFVTTAGFRDLVEIGRQNRSSVYDLSVKRPRPLAARADRIVVRERIAYDGSVLVPLDESSIARAIDELRERDVVSVGVGFLNSHRNDAHERAMADAIARALPHVAVSTSADLVREEREYERFSTALVNAALVPIVGRYLKRVADGTRALGIDATVFVMQSSGGMASLASVTRRPAAIVESGPAAGVIAAARIGAMLGLRDVLSFDMGGTTAKAGTIADGTPEIAYEFEAAGATHSGRATRGSGYSVRFPFVDLAEISAGGGTIARVDAAGVLRVGPLSAGADPGPACYGRGGEPTVTDANLVLGRLDPHALVGGTFAIDVRRAHAAVASVAAPLGGDVVRTAVGIVALVDAEMAKVLRIVSVERGLDPRSFALMAFGGGGPLHACALAEELGIARVVVPEHPGLFSAFGLVVADASVTRSQTLVIALDEGGMERARTTARELTREATAELRAQGIDEQTISCQVDLRYVGQSFDLTLPLAPQSDAQLGERFHREHEIRYGFAARDEAIEIASVRAIVRGGGTNGSARRGTPASAPVEKGATGADARSRDVWDRDRFVSAQIVARNTLAPGSRVVGPAIVEQYDTTTWIPTGWHGDVEPLGNLLLERS
jgi:N-methylhydantoinase A